MALAQSPKSSNETKIEFNFVATQKLRQITLVQK